VTVLKTTVAIFTVLEVLNILTLYFNPGTKMGNGVGVFKAWETSKADPPMHQFVSYLVNWVAGTKLIFIALLIVLLFTADQSTMTLTVVALIATISSFYWRLYPIIKSLDRAGEIDPAGYSRTLGVMITGFIGMLAAALLWTLIRSL